MSDLLKRQADSALAKAHLYVQHGDLAAARDEISKARRWLRDWQRDIIRDMQNKFSGSAVCDSQPGAFRITEPAPGCDVRDPDVLPSYLRRSNVIELKAFGG